MVRSVGIAVALTFGLGLIMVLAALLFDQLGGSDSGGDEDDNGGGSSTPGNNSGGSGLQTTPCRFVSSTALLIVYNAPVSDITQEKARLPGGEAYLISQQRERHVLIQLRDGRLAWADRREGNVAGDCSLTPVDTTPLEAFPTVCAFIAPNEIPRYGNAALTSVIGTVRPGTYPLIGFNRDRYYLFQEEGLSGWVLGTSGQIRGNCTLLPARPG
jgi:hypothetical protein